MHENNQLTRGTRSPMEFVEDHQAIGENTTKFIWFLGQTVRSQTCCPLKVNVFIVFLRIFFNVSKPYR